MTEPVQTVAPTMPASDAWELMHRLQVHHLVVKEGATVVGVLSDRDLGSYRGSAVRTRRTVAELMTNRIVTVNHDDTVRQAANRMRGRTIGCLPVMNKGRVVGIVTISDLLRLIGSGGERRDHSARASLHYRVPHRKQHGGSRSW